MGMVRELGINDTGERRVIGALAHIQSVLSGRSG